MHTYTNNRHKCFLVGLIQTKITNYLRIPKNICFLFLYSKCKFNPLTLIQDLKLDIF